MSEQVKAVVFDVGRVLYHWNIRHLFAKLKRVYLLVSKLDFVKHVDSLEYINANKNLAFRPQYLARLAQDAAAFNEAFADEDLARLNRMLELRNLDIYHSVYLFEEF